MATAVFIIWFSLLTFCAAFSISAMKLQHETAMRREKFHVDFFTQKKELSVECKTVWFKCLFVCSFVYLFVCLLVCLFACLFVRSFVRLFVFRLFVCLFVRSLIRSFVRSFLCFFVPLFLCFLGVVFTIY